MATWEEGVGPDQGVDEGAIAVVKEDAGAADEEVPAVRGEGIFASLA